MALSANQITVTKLYLTVLNRVPDKAGLQFWAGLMDNGMSLATVLNYIGTSAEAKALYPSSLPTDALVTSLYINIFNRLPDPAGLPFWVTQLTNGMARHSLQMILIDAGLAGIDGTTTQSFTNNRLNAATHAVERMLTQNYQMDKQALQFILADVNSDPATLTAAYALIDNDNTGGLGAPSNALTVAAATNGINPTEKAAGVAVTVDLTGTSAAAGNTVELLIGGSPFSTAVTKALTATDITAKSVTVTIPSTASWGADGSKVLTARVKDTSGHVGPDGGAVTVTLDTTVPTAPTNALSIPAATSGINLAMKAAGVGVVVDLTGTNAAAGDTVSVLIASKAFSTPATRVLTASDIAANSAAITIAANDSAWGADGSKVLTARVTDAAGNIGTAGGSLTMTLDTVAPSSPVVAIAAALGGINATEKAAGVAVTVALPTGVAAGDIVTLYIDGATFPTSISKTLTSTDITAKSIALSIPANDPGWGVDGNKTITARVTDRFGNIGTSGTGLKVNLDSSAPSVASAAISIAAATGGISATEKSSGVAVVVDLTGSNAAAGDKLELLLNGASFTTPVIHAITSGEVTAKTLTQVIASTAGWGSDGSKTITARITDVAGNVGTAGGTLVVTLDTTAPTAPTLPVAIAAATNGISAAEKVAGVVVVVNLTGTSAAAGDTVNVLLAGTPFSTPVNYVLTAADITAGNASVTIPVSAGWGTDGSKTINARITDAAGNVGAFGGALVVTVDTAAPGAPSTPISVPAATNGINAAEEAAGIAFTVGFAGTSAAIGDTVELLLGGASFTAPVTHVLTAGEVGANSATVTVPNSAGWGADGTKLVTARFTDAAGNVGTAGGAVSFTLDTVTPGGVTSALTIPASGGGGINSTEKTAGVAVSVDLTGVSIVAGDRLEILIGGASFATPVTHAITSGEIAANTASVTIPTGAGWGADGSKTLTALISDAAGNPATAGGSVTVTLDTGIPTAPTGVTLTPVGGTVVVNAVNSSNTHLTATANIVAGEATGGSAVLTVGGVTIATDNSILIGDTTVTFTTSDGTPTNAELQALIAGGGTAVVTLTDATGNTIDSAVGNPTLIVDYTGPAAPTAVTLTPVGGTVVANTLNATNTHLTGTATITAGAATGGSAILRIGAVTVASDNVIASGDTSVIFTTSDGSPTNAELQALIAAGGVATVLLFDAAGNSTVSSVANPTLVVDYTAPTAPTAVTLTPVGGTVIGNTLNTTNTHLTATANITAGEATGGSAILQIGGVTVATDSTILVGDTTVTFTTSDGSPTNAELQTLIAAGGGATVTVFDVNGNSTVSTVANPTLNVDYTAPTAPTAVTLTPVGGTVVANTANRTNTHMTATATITAGEAAGGSAVLKIGAVTVAIDSSITVGDTTLTFTTSDGTPTNAELQAAIAAGGVATVTVTDANGNSSVSAVGNPTLTVDYTNPTIGTPAFTFVNNAGGAGSYDATDVIKLFFSETVATGSIGVPTLGGAGGNLDNSTIAPIGAAGGYATEFDITLANGTASLSLSAGTTITLVGVDAAGNSANVVWTLT